MDSFSRIVIKQGAGVPTVPASADHRNGDWIATDIYEGEQYMNTDTGVLYSRNGSAITTIGGVSSYTTAEINLTQTSTNIPLADVFVNTLGGTITYARSGVGTYRVTLTGAFTLDKTVLTPNNFTKNGFMKCYRIDANNIQILSYDNALALSDNILEDSSLIIKVYA